MGLVEEITADYPMFIRKFDDTQFAANRACASLQGWQESLRQSHRTRRRISTKTVKGRLKDSCAGRGVTRLCVSRAPQFSRERRIQQTKNALAEIRRFGLRILATCQRYTARYLSRLHQKGD